MAFECLVSYYVWWLFAFFLIYCFWLFAASYLTVMYTPSMNGQSDPTSILRSYTHRFLQLLCVSASVHCENMAPRSLHIISKHLSTLLLGDQSRSGVESRSVETATDDSLRGVKGETTLNNRYQTADHEQVSIVPYCYKISKIKNSMHVDAIHAFVV